MKLGFDLKLVSVAFIFSEIGVVWVGGVVVAGVRIRLGGGDFWTNTTIRARGGGHC